MAQSKVFSGVIWASIQRFGTLAITFVSNMVMARLLTPDDFGTIGMLLFFIAIAQTFVDSGFGSALIQKKHINDADINTVFFINMGMSVVGYSVLFISAPYIASFYEVPILCSLLRVQSLSLLISGVTIIQTVQLTKKMDFKTLSFCSIVGTLALAAAGILAAYFGCGVWSLVIRTLTGAVVTSLMLWLVNKWFPKMLFSKQSFKELFSFGGFMLLSSILISISNNVQGLILGKLFKPSTLGNFTQARTLRNIPSDGIQQVIGQVLYPDFSNHQDNNFILQSKLERGCYALCYVVTSLMFLCILIGEPLIHVVYGSQWDEAIPYFKLLCIGGIPLCLQDININVIKAKGKSHSLFLCNLIKVVFYVILMIIGAKVWGIYGFIIIIVLYSYLAYLMFAIIGTRVINTTIKEQILIILKCVVAAGIPFIIGFMLDSQIQSYNFVIRIIVDSGCYMMGLLAISELLKIEAYKTLKNTLFKK